MRTQREWKFEARPYVDNGHLVPCLTLSSGSALRSGAKGIAIYLDGNRYPGGLEMLNHDVLPDLVLTVEAFPEVISAPAQWRTNDACAVVAIWTKH